MHKDNSFHISLRAESKLITAKQVQLEPTLEISLLQKSVALSP